MALRAPTRIAAAATALALVLVACGDDDDAASSPSTTEETTTTSDEPSTTAGTAPADDPAVDDPGDADDTGDPLVFAADLTGDAEVPGPGDPDGTGRIEIESATPGEWCIDMEATALGADVTDAHIHFGPAGNTGDVVIPIGKPTSSSGDTDTWTDVCLGIEDSLVAEVVDAPEAFYANVHTADFGDGAIRGQLASSSIFDLTLS